MKYQILNAPEKLNVYCVDCGEFIKQLRHGQKPSRCSVCTRIYNRKRSQEQYELKREADETRKILEWLNE